MTKRQNCIFQNYFRQWSDATFEEFNFNVLDNNIDIIEILKILKKLKLSILENKCCYILRKKIKEKK